ncbi:GNAT family N-acetyltransferase [Mycolicibacter hiberniae]|uniref:N-acetyltransferase n=1 Tax=Mycolicibacter hiberniae TaxID=29314 RepID=A0A7I7X5L7_9MYCO|nr:GNAT family N-acetyltransferase [Mycolicibacter hiberniae]MCV7086040.1 N-acetyltransferase [Mycolicibacter hiberniae]ORV70607.1 acetyltransferase [Mycolicibacter hiberniae]BBZ24153.1 N-acetyltransferase [Mycolicibacter hiberniae]
MSEPTVTHDNRQFQIIVDGEQAGFADYIENGDQRIFHHTVVEKEFGGRGLAGTLIGAALDDTRAAGKRVVPTCSFVAGYIAKHPQYADLVDPAAD